MPDYDSPRDPLAERLEAAAKRRKDAKDVAEGERQLRKEYAEIARENGPAEVKRLQQLFAKRVESYNANPAKAFPRLVARPTGVGAGKFQIYLDPSPRLEDFILTVTIGLDGNIAQRMVEVPDIPSTNSHFRAHVDDTGFSWLHEKGTKYKPEQILEISFEWLEKYLVSDADAA
jgi:hypothetical protein